MASVSVNAPKTPVTKGSNGIAAATVPNVCKMPGPPAPFIPTPLPNIGTSDKSPQGYSTSVTIEGQPVAIKGATFNSKGDIASQGTGGGLISSNVQGPTSFVGPGSMDVMIEGKNVQLLGDPMLNNCGPSGSPPNAATAMGLVQAPGTPEKPVSEEQKQKCKEQRAAINEKYQKLGKELRKYDPVADAKGGFMTFGGKLTKPGGHYTEIKDLQRGLKNDLTKFTKECAGSGVALDKNVDRAANAEIVKPPGIP
jgi:uncharacterized Zn-binding protein involved in type VI secretion